MQWYIHQYTLAEREKERESKGEFDGVVIDLKYDTKFLMETIYNYFKL